MHKRLSVQRPVTEGLAGEWTLGDGQLLESVDGCGADSGPSERQRESFARQLDQMWSMCSAATVNPASAQERHNGSFRRIAERHRW